MRIPDDPDDDAIPHFKCSECGVSFYFKENLKSHLKHHEENHKKYNPSRRFQKEWRIL